jgi:EAL domain-containing protein (putative c-di-GMP-specific phosphodiesterase class I)/ActR/RegA family two-component response regulator
VPDPETRSIKRHAFVVDDEIQVRTFVSSVLTSAGLTPHLLASASEVEAALLHWTPDIIVLDLSLGGSDAIDVIRSLAGIRYVGHILLISGHDDETLHEVLEIGERRGLAMLEPLRKPFRVEALRQRLKAVERVPAAESDITLEAALRNNWLELWYQPKIDLHNMLVCGAEGLIRLRHPTEGLVLPERFLPTPGDPLYYALSDYVVARSMKDWMVFARHRMLNRLAINVPASVLQRPSFVANVRRHLPTHPKFPGLIVEITEDEAISDPEMAHEIAVQLKLYDVHVSIDDFGAGYSSLQRLNELPFAEIKLDRSYVTGVADDRQKRAMCEAVIDLAQRFDIVAVAEGVETTDDLRVVMEIGYPVAQGFLFARPMQSEKFVDLLSARAVNP